MLEHKRYGKVFTCGQLFLVIAKFVLALLLIIALILVLLSDKVSLNLIKNIQSNTIRKYDNNSFHNQYSSYPYLNVFQENTSNIQKDESLKRQIEAFEQKQRQTYEKLKDTNYNHPEEKEFIDLSDLKYQLDFSLNKESTKAIEGVFRKSIAEAQSKLVLSVSYTNALQFSSQNEYYSKLINCSNTIIYAPGIEPNLTAEQESITRLFIVYSSTQFNNKDPYFSSSICKFNNNNNNKYYPQIGIIQINLDKIKSNYPYTYNQHLFKLSQLAFTDFLLPVGVIPLISTQKLYKTITHLRTNQQHFYQDNGFKKIILQNSDSYKQLISRFIFYDIEDNNILDLVKNLYFSKLQTKNTNSKVQLTTQTKDSYIIDCSENKRSLTFQDQYIYDCLNYDQTASCFNLSQTRLLSNRSQNSESFNFKGICLKKQCIKKLNHYILKINYGGQEFVCEQNSESFLMNEYQNLICPSDVTLFCQN